MRWREDGRLWLSPPEDIIDIDKEKLLQIIDGCLEWSRSPDCPLHLFSSDVADELEESLYYDLIDQMKVRYGTDDIVIDDISNYDHKLPISIKFEVFNKLYDADYYELQPHELVILRDFLNTLPGQELQAWAKWQKYWTYREEEKLKRDKQKRLQQIKIMEKNTLESTKEKLNSFKNQKIILKILYDFFLKLSNNVYANDLFHISLFYLKIEENIKYLRKSFYSRGKR
ncbi:MAG: hypothetical protein ACRYGR_10345 [Janthinobacterium lividum]